MVLMSLAQIDPGPEDRIRNTLSLEVLDVPCPSDTCGLAIKLNVAQFEALVTLFGHAMVIDPCSFAIYWKVFWYEMFHYQLCLILIQIFSPFALQKPE